MNYYVNPKDMLSRLAEEYDLELLIMEEIDEGNREAINLIIDIYSKYNEIVDNARLNEYDGE